MGKYAWVTLIMCGDSYIPGAIVMAYSLRQVKTTADIVALVTLDVSATGVEELRKVFDVVIRVGYITGKFNHRLTSKQEAHYGKFMSLLPTKFHCLALTQYDKVILMDADTLFQLNSDHLFCLPAPAGIWDFYDPIGTATPADRQLKSIKHGDRIPVKYVEDAFQATFVCWGTSLVLRPSFDDFDALVKMAKDDNRPDFPKCPSGFEEQLLGWYYRNAWTKVGKEYGLVPWKRWGDERTAFVLHFYSDKKPWEYMPEDENVWPDVLIWQAKYREYREWRTTNPKN